MAAPLLRHSASHTAPPPAATALRANRWQHACSPVNLTYNTARREAPVPVAAAAGEAQPSAGSSLAEAAATPLLDAVLERGGRASDVPFHVPGHKRGTSTPPWLSHMLGGALRYDLTELDGEPTGLSSRAGPGRRAHAPPVAAPCFDEQLAGCCSMKGRWTLSPSRSSWQAAAA